MNRRSIIVLVLAVLLSACSRPESLDPPELVLDSMISEPIIIPEDIISSEPTIFIRIVNFDAEGADDLDDLVERKLESCGHRVVQRSEGVAIKVIGEVVHLGPSLDLEAQTVLRNGYHGRIEKTVSADFTHSQYEEALILDLKIISNKDLGLSEQITRIFVGTRRPMPEINKMDIRSYLIAKTADQIKVFFDF